MTAIKAHFDGQVFVPDEPVPLSPGERVLVQAAGGGVPGAARRPRDVSFLRKLNIHLDSDALREIIDDPELGIENF